MNYETATDFELNVKLTEIVLANRYPRAKSIEFDGRQHCFWVNHIGFSSFPVADYCNDWNATMPLAVKHGVGLMCTGSDDYGLTYSATDGLWHHSNSIYPVTMEIQCNGKPLRAVVICLIKFLTAHDVTRQIGVK